jgi:nucleoside-diphosphate-sugar epimerase
MQRTKADTTRIERELGWRATTPQREGLAAQWSRATGTLAAK